MQKYIGETFAFTPVGTTLLLSCTQCGSFAGPTISKTLLQTIPPLSFIRSFDFPAPQEQPIIQEIVSSSDSTIRALEAELTIIQSQISKVRACRDIHSSLLAPIRKLPDEILSEIFMHVRGKAINIDEDLVPIGDLQQVCVRWRSIIRSTPSLWSSFEMMSSQPIRAQMNALTRIQLCLKLSGTYPLSISIRRLQPLTKISNGIFNNIMNHAYRWSSLSFEKESMYGISDMTLSSLESSIQKQGLTQLRILSLKSCHSGRIFRIFRTATALQAVYLYNVNLRNALELAWGKLTRLTIIGCSGDTLLFALPSMIVLEELTVQGDCRALFERSPSSTEIVTLPLLLSLVISDQNINHICSVIRAPRLNSIALSYTNTRSSKEVSSLFIMIEESKSIVKRLQICGSTSNWHTSDSLIINTIEKFQNLEDLSIINQKPTDDRLWKELAWDSNSKMGPLLPSLQILELEFRSRGIKCDKIFSFLEDIMRSRSTSKEKTHSMTSDLIPASLVSVRCSIHHRTTPIECWRHQAAVSQLKTLGEELGIELEVKFPKWVPEESSGSQSSDADSELSNDSFTSSADDES